MLKICFPVVLVLLFFCRCESAQIYFRTPGSELQGELNEAEANGGLHGANADCASNSNEVGATEGAAVAKLEDSSKKMASSHRSSKQDREDDAALAEALSGPCEFGAVERPPETIPEQPSCLPDYASPCPSGWQLDGTLCRASGSYEGECNVVQDLGGFSLEQKKAFARACKVEFNCQTACEKDFHRCPSEWEEVAESVCLAPAEYTGGCDAMLEMSGMSTEDKSLFQTVCGTSWPCLPTSQPDYTSICPDGWTLKAGASCEAPVEYTGPCSKTMEMPASKYAKKGIEGKCSVAWPRREPCSRNYGHPCPAGWLSADGECQAPSSYNGACSKQISFAAFTPEEKVSWALSCDAEWACFE